MNHLLICSLHRLRVHLPISLSQPPTNHNQQSRFQTESCTHTHIRPIKVYCMTMATSDYMYRTSPSDTETTTSGSCSRSTLVAHFTVAYSFLVEAPPPLVSEVRSSHRHRDHLQRARQQGLFFSSGPSACSVPAKKSYRLLHMQISAYSFPLSFDDDDIDDYVVIY